MNKIRSLEELESEWSEMESEWESLKKEIMIKNKFTKSLSENVEKKHHFIVPSDEEEDHSDSSKEYEKPISTIPFEIKYEEILRDYQSYQKKQNLDFISSNTYICAFYNGMYGYSFDQLYYPRKGYLQRIEEEENGYRTFVIRSVRGYLWNLNEQNYDIFYREGKPEIKTKLRRELESICYGKNIRIRKRRVPLDLIGKKKNMNKFMEKLENEENQDLYEKIESESESDIGEIENDSD